jgi:hypothetical protein
LCSTGLIVAELVPRPYQEKASAMVDLDISSDPCPWCNETYVLDLFEVWPGERAWMF